VYYVQTLMSQTVAKNTIIYTGGLIAQKVLAFIFTLLIARLLGVEGNGRVFAAVTFGMMFAVVADLGVTNIFIREGAQNPSDRQNLFAKSFTLRVVNGIVMVGLTSLVAWLLNYDLDYRKLILLASISSFFEAIHVLFFAALRTVQQLKYEAMILFSGQAVQIILGTILLYEMRSPVAVIYAILATNIFNVLVSYLVIRRKLDLRLKFSYDIGALWRFGKLALPFTLAGIFVKIYSYVGGVMLSRLADDHATGLFGNAYKFTYAFQFLPLAFVAGLYPAFASMYGKDNDKIVTLFERAQWYMATIAFPLVAGIWAVADPLITTLYGAKFAPAIPTLTLLVPVLAFIFLEFPIASLLNATHRQNTKTFLSGMVMVVNLGLNFWLIPTMRERGAAIADLVSFGFMFIAGLTAVLLAFPINVSKLAKTYLRPLVASAVMYAVAASLKGHISILIVVLVAVIVYPAALWIVGGVRKNDIEAFMSLIRRKPALTPVPGEVEAV